MSSDESLVGELKKLAELHASGVLNDAEFAAAKESLLARYGHSDERDDVNPATGDSPKPVAEPPSARPVAPQTEAVAAPPPPHSADGEDPATGVPNRRTLRIPSRLVVASLVGLAMFLIVVVAYGNPDEQGRDSASSEQGRNSTASPRISSRMTGCNLSTTDGTITGAVAITNRSTESVDVRASLLFHHQGTRVGEGSGFTTLRPNESAEIAIIGASSRWPSWYGEADGYVCTHEAVVVD